MKSCSTPGILLALLVALGWFYSAIAASTESRQLRGSGQSQEGSEQELTCRVTIVDTMFEVSANTTNTNEEQISCIPIINGEETDDLLDLPLPDDIAELNNASIELGDLYLSIPGATIEGNSVVIPSSPLFIVLDPPEQRRQLSSSTIGPKTLAIVRVSTSDKSPTFSATTLRDGIFGKGVNMISQYDACSFGQLRWEAATVGVGGLVEVRVNQRVAEFTSASALVTAAQKQIKNDLGISSVAALAEKVLFCLPPGTPGDWIASAGMGHWRAQFNDEWCLSLSGKWTEQQLTVFRFAGIQHASGFCGCLHLTTGYLHVLTNLFHFFSFVSKSQLRCMRSGILWV
jgi:hypothetical protein